jgi:hypothetical protein
MSECGRIKRVIFKVVLIMKIWHLQISTLSTLNSKKIRGYIVSLYERFGWRKWLSGREVTEIQIRGVVLFYTRFPEKSAVTLSSS